MSNVEPIGSEADTAADDPILSDTESCSSHLSENISQQQVCPSFPIFFRLINLANFYLNQIRLK